MIKKRERNFGTCANDSLNTHKLNPSRELTRKSRVWHRIGTIKGASSPAEIIFWLAEILISARWWNMNAETLNRIMLQHNWLERNLMWVIYNSMIYTWYSSVLFASVHNIFCYSNTLLKSLIAPWPLGVMPPKNVWPLFFLCEVDTRKHSCQRRILLSSIKQKWAEIDKKT